MLPAVAAAATTARRDGGSIYATPEEQEDQDACKVIVSLVPLVYAPSILYSVGEAITDPVLLLYATDTLGTSVATAAFAVSVNHYGKLLSNVPAEMLYTQLGPGPSMFVAAVRLTRSSTAQSAPGQHRTALMVQAGTRYRCSANSTADA